MIIRAETPQDYPIISHIHQWAFEERLSEGLIVALHRQRLNFDPDLSLVAEENGQIVGHVLFTPHTLRILGEDVRAVNLAPVSVHPAHQKRGIGSQLIEEGHRIAREKGFQISFLLGHPEYYVKFGYKTHAYGSALLTVDREALKAVTIPEELTGREVKEADIPELMALWKRQMQNVDFSFLPEATLLDWKSPNPAYRSMVYLMGDNIVGYSRGNDASNKFSVFLARDDDTARQIYAFIATQNSITTLPVHPRVSWADTVGESVSTAWEAGMATSLISHTVFDDYYARVQRQQHPSGQVIWGTVFDL